MESRKSQLPQLLIPLVFLALGALGVLTHEFWRDEASPWLIIQSSDSIREMIANLGYTGHTLTFFVWQYFLFKFFHTPLAGSIANLLFMTVAIYVFVRTSPFSTVQKWLFALGFYPLYQYAVFNRMYAFLVFFLFAYCALYIAKPHRTLLRWLMLILMAETHIIGMLAAIPLALLDIMRTWGKGKSKFETLFLFFKLSFFIFALVTVIWQIWPADQSYHSLHPASPFLVFVGFADAFFPNFGIFYQSYFQIAVGTVLWLAATVALWRGHSALITYGALALPFALFSAIIYTGHRWHHGFFWIYWIMAIWLTGAPLLHRARFRNLLTALLALQAAMGLYALGDDALHPYSSGQEIAHHIQKNNLWNLPMVGAEVFRDSQKGIVYKWEVDQLQPTMLALTGARVYDPRAGEWLSFWNHYDSKLYFPRRSLAEFESDLKAVAQKIGAPFLLIVATEAGLPDIQMPSQLTLLNYFGRPANQPHSGIEGEAPTALPVEGATRAPIVDYGEHLSLYQFSSR